MKEQIIPYTERLGFTKLFRDFIDNSNNSAAFIEPNITGNRAGAIASQARNRDAAVDILTRQNNHWQAPAQVMDNISKLGAKDAVTVIAGQQACLFGGPYLVILKALATVRMAQNLEQQLSLPVVPIFWIAADDHDFQEISSAHLFDASGSIASMTIDFDAEMTYPPIGALTYDQSIIREIERLQSVLPDNDFKRQSLDPIIEYYRPGKKIVDCFAEYLLSIIGRFGIILFNPHDKKFKQAITPTLQSIVSRHDDLKDTLAKSESGLKEAGYHIQVRKSSTAAHLFYHAPERLAIHRTENGFKAGERDYSQEDLIETIAARPLKFSPDVLTRPLIQSSFFPTAAIIGGPAEIAYYAQLMPLFDLFDLMPPGIYARPSVSFIEKRFEKLLIQHQIIFDDLAGDIEPVINRILREKAPDKIDKHLSDLAVSVKNSLDEIKADLPDDPGIGGTVERTGEKIDYQLKELGKKIFAAHKKKHKTERDRIYRMQETLFPNRALAERSIIPAYLVSRHGSGIIDFLFESITPDETGHRLLMLSEYNG